MRVYFQVLLVNTCRNFFLVCIHIYLAAKVLGYITFFDIRKPETSEIELRLISKPDLDSSDQEMFSADFHQTKKLVEPVINDFGKLENQDQSMPGSFGHVAS